ncbi:hypothetical protein [Streptomyces alboniger]|uniref:Uncharacterized protein n=1 Tax=Streptomyces alboniger TaxID=132473 RepID=A0A5J6HH95_STRAD|nr:hypothetical protein [Streptomyces alboniger]QEV16577.1 hypothetical protein CP975_02810 [Streptomyces alboniger]
MCTSRTWRDLLEQVLRRDGYGEWRDFREALSAFGAEGPGFRALHHEADQIICSAQVQGVQAPLTVAEWCATVSTRREQRDRAPVWSHVELLVRVWSAHHRQDHTDAQVLLDRWASAYRACGGTTTLESPERAAPGRRRTPGDRPVAENVAGANASGEVTSVASPRRSQWFAIVPWLRPPRATRSMRPWAVGTGLVMLAGLTVTALKFSDWPATGDDKAVTDSRTTTSASSSPPTSPPAHDDSSVPSASVPCLRTCRDIKLGGTRKFDIESWGSSERNPDVEAASQSADNYELRPLNGARLQPMPGGGELDATKCPQGDQGYSTAPVAAPPTVNVCLLTAEGTRVMLTRQEANQPYRLFHASVLERRSP